MEVCTALADPRKMKQEVVLLVLELVDFQVVVHAAAVAEDVAELWLGDFMDY